MNNSPIPIRPTSVDFTPPDFDADDWISHAFAENGEVKLVIRNEHGEDGPTFSPVEAREIGTRLIQLSFEITTTIARENGLRGAAPLRDVMMQLGVDYTDEIHAALKTSEDTKGGDNA